MSHAGMSGRRCGADPRSDRGARERGSGLIVIIVMVLFMTLSAFAVMTYADAAYQRVNGDWKLEKAGAIADGGLSYYVEQWRRTPAVLNSSGAYPVTRVADNPNFEVARPLGGGTFMITRIERVTLGAGSATEGRVVTIRGEYDGTRNTFRALLAPNLNSPIQGVGTTSTQTWLGTSKFTATGTDFGTIFGNSTLGVSAGAMITGNAKFSGAITNAGTITGTKTTGAAPVSFPDQIAIVNAAINQAATNKATAGFWQDSKANFLAAGVAAGGVKPTSMERIPAAATNLNNSGETIWTGTNTMNQAHYMIRGGNLTMPAGNYAFGRLYLDGTILTLKAPAGGATIVVPDLYLANGARLILDATDGPFNIVTGKNNAYEGSISATGAETYSNGTNAFTAGTPALTMPGDSGIWRGESGGSDPVKKSKGNGHLDDWQIKDGSLLAIVTSDPNAKGAELFMKTDVDLTLANGSGLLSGIQASNLTALKSSATSMSSITAMERNATGFAAWSAGGGNPRLDINTDAGAGGNPSIYGGLTYGAWPGRIGANGTLEGAFVGSTLRNAGTIIYDSRLAAAVSTADANSHHVVVKTRVQ